MRRAEHPLLPCSAIRAIEREAIAAAGPGVLMARAAAAVADAAERLLRRLPPGTPVHGFCGPGNNGGDALLAIMMLDERGWPAQAFELADARAGAQPPEDTARVRAEAAGAGRLPTRIDDTTALKRAIDGDGRRPAPLLLDGLFGIGLARRLDGLCAEFCRLSREAGSTVIAIDVPSGLDADTGAIVGGADAVAVRARLTVTMIADKPGLHTGAAADHAGEVRLEPLGLEIPGCEAAGEGSERATGLLFGSEDAAALLPSRPRDSSKGRFGSVLVIGGGRGMTGAALLAARGAQCAGAGKTWIASPDGPVFDPGEPQLMTRDAGAAFPERAVLVAGCGLGTGPAARALVERVLACELPAVLDADALNLMAGLSTGTAAPRVLTPHPLEAARLAQTTIVEIQRDRIGAALALARAHAAIVLLKGAGTVVATPDGNWSIIDAGGPALATAGSGDVLAGLIGGLLAQGLAPYDAARLGAWVHGSGADRWSDTNGHPAGLSAGELPELARAALGLLARGAT